MTSDRRPPLQEGPDQLAAGDVLARKYRLLETLGEGGMAVVWVAHNIALDTKVAVKILRSNLTNDPKFISRVQKEAKATASIAHKNIVQVFDYGVTAQGSPYIVMELLHGETLAERLKARGKLRPAEAARVVLRAMKGITVAHAKGIIHRDLKPENIFLALEDNGMERPKVLDFGVASVMRDTSDERSKSTGMVGTPAYLPPETIEHDKRGDARGDVWALGVMLYEMITGVLPFQGKTAHGLLKSIVEDPAEPMNKLARGVDPRLEAIVTRALAKAPEQRYPGVREMFDDLNRWLGDIEASVSIPRLSASPLGVPADPHSDEEGPTVVGPALDASGAAVTTAHPSSPPTASSHPTMRAAAPARTPITPYLVGAIGGLALLLGVLLIVNARRPPVDPTQTATTSPPTAGAPTTGSPSIAAPATSVSLDISSLPEGALVYLDDEKVDLPHDVRRGSNVHVRVEAPGFLTWSEDVAAEGAVRLTFVGVPKPASLPPRAWHPPKPVGDYKEVPYLISSRSKAKRPANDAFASLFTTH